jgi:hypothetical protein
MRILGFSQKWDKLDNDLFFTTFRFARKDAPKGRDWAVEEVVQIYYKPRSPKREYLGIARIIRKEPKDLNKRFIYWQALGSPSLTNTSDTITPDEAENDGFEGNHGGGDTEKMRRFFQDTYGYSKCHNELINKLTLYWINKEVKP